MWWVSRVVFVYATVDCGTGDRFFNEGLSLSHDCGRDIIVAPQGFGLGVHYIRSLMQRFTLVNVTAIMGNRPLCCRTAGRGNLDVTKLGFPGGTSCGPFYRKGRGIAPFRFVPCVLNRYRGIYRTLRLLGRVGLIGVGFDRSLPLSPLRFVVDSDRGSVAIRYMDSKLGVCSGPINIVAGGPAFS